MFGLFRRHKVESFGDITQVGPRVRIEPGPRVKQALATAELLSDEATAAHYKIGRPDAHGKPIEIGQPMTYAAWGGTKQPREIEFKVYGLEQGRWALKGAFDTHDEALAFAKTIYGA